MQQTKDILVRVPRKKYGFMTKTQCDHRNKTFLTRKQKRFDSKNDDSKRRKKRRYCDQKQTTIRQNCGNRTMILLAYKNYNSLPIKKTSKHEETQQNLCQKAKCRGRRP